MSEPIILTERERAVFAELVSHLMGEANNRDTERAWQLGEVLRAWLRDMEPPTESASPPRVPVSSAHSSQVGVQSGPGQPTEYERGYRAGIEAAAKWLDARRATLPPLKIKEAAAAIRALADKPAPVASTPLSEAVKRARGGNAPTEKEGYA